MLKRVKFTGLSRKECLSALTKNPPMGSSKMLKPTSATANLFPLPRPPIDLINTGEWLIAVLDGMIRTYEAAVVVPSPGAKRRGETPSHAIDMDTHKFAYELLEAILERLLDYDSDDIRCLEEQVLAVDVTRCSRGARRPLRNKGRLEGVGCDERADWLCGKLVGGTK